MMVEVPTANITAMENRALVKGMARLTALMAYSLTPRDTSRPSTMEYRENTMRDAAVADTNLTKSERRLFPSSCKLTNPFCARPQRPVPVVQPTGPEGQVDMGIIPYITVIQQGSAFGRNAGFSGKNLRFFSGA